MYTPRTETKFILSVAQYDALDQIADEKNTSLQAVIGGAIELLTGVPDELPRHQTRGRRKGAAAKEGAA